MKPVRKPWLSLPLPKFGNVLNRQPRMGGQGEGGRARARAADRRSASSSVGTAQQRLHAARPAGRHRRGPQRHRHGVRRMRLDVPRRRSGRDEMRRRGRVRERHGGDERQRPLRQDPGLRRHCRPCRPAHRRQGARGVGSADRAGGRPLLRHPLLDRPRRRPGDPPGPHQSGARPDGRQDLARGLRAAGQARPHLRFLALPSADRRARPTWPAPFPRPSMVLDHVGGPLGYARYAGRHAEIFATWKKSMAELAAAQRQRQAGRARHAHGLLRFLRAADPARLRGAGRPPSSPGSRPASSCSAPSAACSKATSRSTR